MTKNKEYSEADMKRFIEKLPFAKEGEFIPGPLVATGWKNFEKYLQTRGRPKKDNPKKRVDLRFDPDVLSGLKKHFGRGWSTKVNDTMRSLLSKAGVL
jgi:hypothetical protein